MYPNSEVHMGNRHIVIAHLTRSDMVRIADFSEETCWHCNDDIGIDYGMYEYVNQWWSVEGLDRATDWDYLECGAKVFLIDGFYWSTCWINGWYNPEIPLIPSWEV